MSIQVMLWLLIWAALFGKAPVALAKGIAALLRFDYPGDPEAMALQKTMSATGIEEALWQYDQLAAGHPLVRVIKQQYKLVTYPHHLC